MAVLTVTDLCTDFRVPGGTIRAVDHVSLTLPNSGTLGLVGESGCGKSTLGKTIMRLIEPSEGRIVLDGVDITKLRRSELLPHRSKMQMIFQDPYASLNPRTTAGRTIEEPLLVNGHGDASARADRVAWLMDRVGLRPEAASRYPHEFSGGQRQRIGIARALALNPKAIVCDEAVSALDVSIRAQILNLLVDLQDELGLAYLFISHDLSVIEHICDEIAVMYLGAIVERGGRDDLCSAPIHPYTQSLMSAVPVPDPKQAQHRRRVHLQGELPDPANPPPGCRFHTRCPVAMDLCSSEAPRLAELPGGRAAACHRITTQPGGGIDYPRLDPSLTALPTDRSTINEPIV